MNHCQKKCLGLPGNHGGCCTVDNRDWIIGPITDPEAFLERLRKKFPGIEINWNDVFIAYEEGSKLFPNKVNWQNPQSYPCLRVDIFHKNIPCIFYNWALKTCSVYEIRPNTCRNFYCEYLHKVLNNTDT